MSSATLVWFRLDLRLADNPALSAAIDRGAVIPVFIWSPDEETPWQPGAASRWWLHQSLSSLQASFRKLGSELIVRQGPALEMLEELLRETSASGGFWNRRYEPALIARDARIKEVLARAGYEVKSFSSALLHEPWTIENSSRKPFQVFTPFFRHWVAKANPSALLPAPKFLPPPAAWPGSLQLDQLELEPKRDWADEFRSVWQPGECGASEALKRFLNGGFSNYDSARNRPDRVGTSRLSPHLHFGEISPGQIWHGVAKALRAGNAAAQNAAPFSQSQFIKEVAWREFAHHLLYHFPTTPGEPLRTEFNKFKWRNHPAWLDAWQRGRTGYPIVDAGMRELWATGWMHNRVRMIAASFLVKDLLISWQEGARWFWDTLVDADLAQNTLGWQWTAGCGADAAPFFRIFNPVLQGAKFDPEGTYVRRWCPELAKLPAKWIHQPHAAPADVLRQGGVELGVNYPNPIVSHAIAREVALEAYSKLKE